VCPLQEIVASLQGQPFSFPPSTVQAFLRCGEKEPLAHSECDDGLPAIRDGYCDAEEAGIFKCVQAPDKDTVR